MKTQAILHIILAVSAFTAQAAKSTSPKLPDSILARYWHAIAVHHAQNAALQASMTSQQKQMQESIAAIDKEIDSLRAQLAQACGDKASLEESGPDPVCVEKAENKADPAKKK